jgi:SAM-dependent methyltransferase
MVDVHRYHEISESTHRIMNPLTVDRMMLLGEICRLRPGIRMLDLACGKGEMLCQFALAYGVNGVGIDIYPPLLAVAGQRAQELGVSANVDFVEGDAGGPLDVGGFDVVSCIGATWIGCGLRGTLEIMRRHVDRSGWLLVGDVYWARPPSAEMAHGYGQDFASLEGTLDIFDDSGVDLVEMVLSSLEEWDRYAASQWLNVADWVAGNPGHPDAPAVLAERNASRRRYLSEGRATMGWGVFVGRRTAGPSQWPVPGARPRSPS